MGVDIARSLGWRGISVHGIGLDLEAAGGKSKYVYDFGSAGKPDKEYGVRNFKAGFSWERMNERRAE